MLRNKQILRALQHQNVLLGEIHACLALSQPNEIRGAIKDTGGSQYGALLKACSDVIDGKLGAKVGLNYAIPPIPRGTWTCPNCGAQGSQEEGDSIRPCGLDGCSELQKVGEGHPR